MSVLEIANRVRVLVLLGCLGLAAIASPAGREARAQDTDRGPAASRAGSGAGSTAARPMSRRIPRRPTRADRAAEGGESFLGWMIRASGPIGVAIALMSFYLVALVVKMFLDYRSTVAAPRELVSDVEDLLDKGKYNEAYNRLVEDESFLARVLAAGVRKLPAGMTQAHRAMELANEDVTMQMEHRTTYLATVGTLGPMIGLVGTVYGMILAFRVIAQAGSSPQASDLAKGISTALFATLEGIAISIPAIYFYAMFRNRIARLSLEVGMTAEPLLEQFAPGVRPAGPDPAPNAAASPAVPPSPPPMPTPSPSAPRWRPRPAAARPALPPAGPSPAVSSD